MIGIKKQTDWYNKKALQLAAFVLVSELFTNGGTITIGGVKLTLTIK